jgi:hypothetical protein
VREEMRVGNGDVGCDIFDKKAPKIRCVCLVVYVISLNMANVNCLLVNPLVRHCSPLD